MGSSRTTRCWPSASRSPPAALLATPVLNLFYPPIVLVGAVHLLGRVEDARAGDGRCQQIDTDVSNRRAARPRFVRGPLSKP